MSVFGAAHGWGAKRLPLPKICHTYPTVMKLGTVIPYVTHLSAFFERWSWFKLGLALDTNKSQEVFGANSYACRSYRRKTVRGAFLVSPILNRINIYQGVFMHRKNGELRDQLSKEVFSDFRAQLLPPNFLVIELFQIELCQIPVKLNNEYELGAQICFRN